MFTQARSRMAGHKTVKTPSLSLTQAFLVEEFKALRAEIEGRAREVHQTVVFAATANAAVASWALANADKICGGNAAYQAAIGAIPLLVTIPLFLRWCAAHRAIHRIGNYIQRLEEAIRLPQGLGWETSLRPHGIEGRRKNLTVLETVFLEGLFWLVVSIIGVGFGYGFGTWGRLFPSLFDAPCWK